jgi:hypothetical protein
VLAVVEEQERLHRAQSVRERFDQVPALFLADAKSSRGGVRDEILGCDRSELDQPDAVGEVAEKFPGDFECEPRLAAPARAHERDESVAFEHACLEVAALAVASDEARDLCRQVVRSLGQRAQRRLDEREIFVA